MTAAPGVLYALEPSLSVAEFKQVLIASGLAAIRPVADDERLAAMLAGADLVLTARLDQPDRPLVGLARGITDGAWCCYLSDLAVSALAQGFGVGRGLLDETRRQLGPDVSPILVSVPEATGFYERAGTAGIPNAFWFRRQR